MNESSGIHEMTEAVFQAMNTRDFTAFEQNITDDVAFDFPVLRRTVRASLRTLPMGFSFLD